MYKNYFKRILDIVISLAGLVFSLPILLIMAILLKLTGHRKIFFIQKRVGWNERLFSLYKICTMTEEKDEQGKLLPDEKRLTSLGKFIRKTSLDELPQMLNVLKGDMSLIGPRPLLIEYLPLYSEEQKKRHHIRPGITGWAQVNGRNAIDWKTKFELDVWYVNHCSLLLDLRIIFKTIAKIFLSKDINQAGNATMEPFRGN